MSFGGTGDILLVLACALVVRSGKVLLQTDAGVGEGGGMALCVFSITSTRVFSMVANTGRPHERVIGKFGENFAQRLPSIHRGNGLT